MGRSPATFFLPSLKPFGSGEVKNRFSRWPPMLPTKFQVNWLLGLGEVKKRFSKWPPWHPAWISYQHDFSYF